jgi:uncharacterized protein YlxP (DUF503 family)
MLVATLQVELLLRDCFSLKEKRFVLQSLKKRIQNRFNVSVAEVDLNDVWQRASLGFACVSNDRRFLDSQVSKLLNAVIQEDRGEVIDQRVEIL